MESVALGNFVANGILSQYGLCRQLWGLSQYRFLQCCDARAKLFRLEQKTNFLRPLLLLFGLKPKKLLTIRGIGKIIRIRISNTGK